MAIFTVEITHKFEGDHRQEKLLEILLEKMHLLINQNQKIMSLVEDLSAQVDALQVSIDTKQEQIAAAIAAFEQTIADLQSQIGSGAATPEQLQAILDKVTAAKADLESTPTA